MAFRYDPLVPMIIGGFILGCVAFLGLLALLIWIWETWCIKEKGRYSNEYHEGRAVAYWVILTGIIVFLTGFLASFMVS